MAGYLSACLRVLFWLAILALAGLAVWLPAFIPEAAKAFIGHAVVTVSVIGALAAWLLNGLAEAMRS